MSLFSWGANSYGQLALGLQSEQCLYPSEILKNHPIEEVVSVAAGGGHTLVLDTAGTLLGVGSNKNGQLCDCKDNTTVLSRIEDLQEFKLVQIECGWESSYAVTDNRALLVWGSNKYGQLGLSKDKVTTTNQKVILQTPQVVQVSAGLRHTALVTVDGHVFICGQGNRGQLGVLNSDKNVPKGEIDTFVPITGLENIEKVACGQHHTLALSTDGRLYGWGDNRRGQLGEGETFVPTPKHIATFESPAIVHTGWTHSAVLSGGRVFTWGRNNYNQLGHSCGQPQVNTPSPIQGLEGVKQLQLGSEHNMALLENGEVWTWGWNEHGNCGTGTTDNIPEPSLITIPHPVRLIAAGAGHSLALCEAV